MKLAQLRETRAQTVDKMKSIVEAANDAGRDLSADETKQFDQLKAEERSLAEKVERAEYLSEVERRSHAAPVSDNASTDYDRLAGQVSVLKVMQAQMEGRSLDGVEAEYAREAEIRSGRKAQGAFIPLQALETRVNDTTSAAPLVATDNRPDLFISPLRNALLARRLGVRVLTGLRGDVPVPKLTGSIGTGWVTEGGAVPENDATFGEVNLTPKHVGGKTEMSRQLIQQSSPDIEQLVRGDLAAIIAEQLDLAIIAGTGLSGQPQGIIGHPDVQTAPMPTSWATVLGVSELIELANATAVNWLSAPDVKTDMASTEKSTGTGIYLLQNGQMDDKPYFVTNQMPAATLLLGDFSQILLGVWSEIDILVNPFAEPAYTRGGVQVRAMATADVGLRHGESFVVASGV